MRRLPKEMSAAQSHGRCHRNSARNSVPRDLHSPNVAAVTAADHFRDANAHL
jgi:hypothetical protein